jgi:hypothetical protein
MAKQEFHRQRVLKNDMVGQGQMLSTFNLQINIGLTWAFRAWLEHGMSIAFLSKSSFADRLPRVRA